MKKLLKISAMLEFLNSDIQVFNNFIFLLLSVLV